MLPIAAVQQKKQVDVVGCCRFFSGLISKFVLWYLKKFIVDEVHPLAHSQQQAWLQRNLNFTCFRNSETSFHTIYQFQ